MVNLRAHFRDVVGRMRQRLDVLIEFASEFRIFSAFDGLVEFGKGLFESVGTDTVGLGQVIESCVFLNRTVLSRDIHGAGTHFVERGNADRVRNRDCLSAGIQHFENSIGGRFAITEFVGETLAGLGVDP